MINFRSRARARRARKARQVSGKAAVQVPARFLQSTGARGGGAPATAPGAVMRIAVAIFIIIVVLIEPSWADVACVAAF
jgi:hypothetical protein